MMEDQLRIWPIPISFIFLVLGLLNSKLLTPLNLAWVKFGELLGRIVAPIVMAIIYFVIITPIGLFMRLIGKDLLNTKFSKDNSYWIKKAEKYWFNEKAILMLSFLREFWEFLKERKKYWLLPIIIVLALFGILIVLSQGSAVAPFIYTIF